MSQADSDTKTLREYYLETIVDLQPELVCRFLSDSTLTFVNKAYCEAFGLSKELLVGRKFLDFIPVKEHQYVLDSIQSLNAYTKSQTYVHEAIMPDGSIVWQQWTDVVILDELNNVVEIQSTGKDITDQIIAERERDLQTNLQKLIFKISATYINIPIELFDETINQSLQEIGEFCDADRVYVFDYNFEENYVSNTFEWCSDGVSPQIHTLQNVPLDNIGEWIEKHSRDDIMLIEDVRNLPADSPTRQILEPQDIISLLVIPVMSNLKCVGFIGLDYVRSKREFGNYEEKLLRLFAQLLINARNRRSTQNVLLEREQFLADLINKSSSIIVVKSADGEYQLVNEMWEQVFGLNKAIVIGKTDYDLFPLHIRKQLLCSHNDVIATGSTLEHETIIESGNKIRYFLYTSFPIHDARGRINGICSIGMEITDRKIADEERLALARAEATSQAKSTFLKNISRDIRSPLNTIIGITQTLQNNSTSPHSEQINSIHRSTRQLMSLVNNIFDFSKLETGSLQLLMSDFSLAVLLDDIQAMYSEKAIEKGVEVRLIMESGVPESIRSDESRLRQILINVVGNAVKFTTDGYVQIKVSAKRNLQRMLSPQTKYDFELTFEISDSGKGISQNQLSSIFTTFRQSRVPTDKSGSGLGLAITKALVDLMSGTIHVDSELKNGSRFTIKLPVNKISRL